MITMTPETERLLSELEAAADRFANHIGSQPGESEGDTMWLRVNRLRDRIVYGYGQAREEARRIRQQRIEARERQEMESTHVHA